MQEQANSGQGRRIPVIANKTCPCAELHEEIERHTHEIDADVLVVAPALNSRLKHLATDVDGAMRAARERLDGAIEDLGRRGVKARGELGDAQPLQAIEDALYSFDADELIISSFPAGDSHWLEKDLLERTRERVDLPITHVVSHYGLEAE